MIKEKPGKEKQKEQDSSSISTTPNKTDNLMTTPVKKNLPATPSSGQKGKNVTLYKGGEKHDEGVKIVIHPTKFKTLDQVKENVGRKVGTPVKKVYNMQGTLLNSLDEFEDGSNYVVCSQSEVFSKESIPEKAREQQPHTQAH